MWSGRGRAAAALHPSMGFHKSGADQITATMDEAPVGIGMYQGRSARLVQRAYRMPDNAL
jgi:hypothetical protein